MKYLKFAYWITTWIFFLCDFILPAFTFKFNPAKESSSSVEYPDHFGSEVTLFKSIGGVLSILPLILPKYKKRAYLICGLILIPVIIADQLVSELGLEFIFVPIILMILLVCGLCLLQPIEINTFD